MYFNPVWDIVDPPECVRHISYEWSYERKRGMEAKVKTFNARLVAKSYTQNEGINYKETFSPVAMLKSICNLLSVIAYYDYEI